MRTHDTLDWRCAVVWLPLAAVLSSCVAPIRPTPEDRVARGLEMLGGIEAIAGGVSVDGQGEVDLAVLQQGMAPGTPELVAHRERLTLAPGGARLAFEYDTPVNPDARESMRYIVDDGSVAGIVLDAGFGFWEDNPAIAPRLRGLSPHLLLAEALETPELLRDLGASDDGGHGIGVERAGETLELQFAAGGAFTGFTARLDVPLRGDTDYRWRLLPTLAHDGFGPYPGGYEVWLGEDLLRRVQFTRVRAGLDESLVAIPERIVLPERQAPQDTREPEPADEAEPIVYRELSPGVHLALNVRPGFHHLVVEGDEGLVVVDAPAGWLETMFAPPFEWVSGATSSSIAAAFLDSLEQRFPGSPVRHLILTHWHSDHAGGVRAFAARGAEILGAPQTLRAVRSALDARFTLAPDEYLGEAPTLRSVEGRLELGAGPRRLQLVDIGHNPHAEGMLVVRLPGHGILFQSDLFEPLPQRVFPPPAREPVMRWFVDWLDRQGLAGERLFAVHGTGVVEPWMLEAMRQAGSAGAMR